MKYLVTVLCIGLALVAMEAARADSPAGARGIRYPGWQDEVGLSAEQREELRKVQAAGGTREDIRAILTPEQQAKILELKRAHKGDGPDPEQLKETLGLSDEQVAQMKKIRQEGGSRRQMAEVLTPEQRDKLKALRPGGAHRLPPPPLGSTPAGQDAPGWGLNPG